MADHGTDSRYAMGCRCDECRRAHSDGVKAWRERNPDYQRWHEAHRDEQRAYQRQRHAENREAINARKCADYAASRAADGARVVRGSGPWAGGVRCRTRQFGSCQRRPPAGLQSGLQDDR